MLTLFAAIAILFSWGLAMDDTIMPLLTVQSFFGQCCIRNCSWFYIHSYTAIESVCTRTRSLTSHHLKHHGIMTMAMCNAGHPKRELALIVWVSHLWIKCTVIICCHSLREEKLFCSIIHETFPAPHCKTPTANFALLPCRQNGTCCFIPRLNMILHDSQTY